MVHGLKKRIEVLQEQRADQPYLYVYIVLATRMSICPPSNTLIFYALK